MFDIVSDLNLKGLSGILSVFDNGEAFTLAVDTANVEPGVTFCFARVIASDGDIVLDILESDTDVEEDFVPVARDSLIGSLEEAAKSTASIGEPLPSVGVFSNKRYLKASLTVTNASGDSGETGYIITVATKAEVLPSV